MATTFALGAESIAYRLVRLSVCNVDVSWSYRLEFFENNFTDDQPHLSSLSADPNTTDLLQREHPEILTGIGVG